MADECWLTRWPNTLPYYLRLNFHRQLLPLALQITVKSDNTTSYLPQQCAACTAYSCSFTFQGNNASTSSTVLTRNVFAQMQNVFVGIYVVCFRCLCRKSNYAERNSNKLRIRLFAIDWFGIVWSSSQKWIKGERSWVSRRSSNARKQ